MRDNESRKTACFARRDRMTRNDFERDANLTLPLVLSMITGRSFRSVTGFSAYFFKNADWGRAFGRFLVRENIMSLPEFRGYFSDRRGRSGVAVRNQRQQELLFSQPADAPKVQPEGTPLEQSRGMSGAKGEV